VSRWWFAPFLALATWLAALPPAWAADGARWAEAPMVAEAAPPVAPAGGWRTVPGLHADVHAAEADLAVARRLADHGARAIPALARRLALPAGTHLQVYVAPDAAAFSAAQPSEPPEWADGTAWPRQGLVFLRAPRARDGTADALEQVLDHEIVHVLVGQAFLPRDAPRALGEGIAQFFAGQAIPRANGAATEGLPRFSAAWEIFRAFPSDAARAKVRYTQAADFVAWFAAEHGEDGLVRWIGALAGGQDQERALQAAVGIDQQALEAEWSARAHGMPRWLKRALDSQAWWLFGAVGLAVGGYRRVKRKRLQMKRLELEEAWARAEGVAS
jgi:hypothetical protein